MEKLQEKEEQPFSNCQWNEKDEKGGIDQGEESQEDIDWKGGGQKEEGSQVLRGRGGGAREDASSVKERIKEVKNQKEIQSWIGRAWVHFGHRLVIVAVWLLRVCSFFIRTQVDRPTLMRCHHHHHHHAHHRPRISSTTTLAGTQSTQSATPLVRALSGSLAETFHDTVPESSGGRPLHHNTEEWCRCQHRHFQPGGQFD